VTELKGLMWRILTTNFRVIIGPLQRQGKNEIQKISEPKKRGKVVEELQETDCINSTINSILVGRLNKWRSGWVSFFFKIVADFKKKGSKNRNHKSQITNTNPNVERTNKFRVSAFTGWFLDCSWSPFLLPSPVNKFKYENIQNSFYRSTKSAENV